MTEDPSSDYLPSTLLEVMVERARLSLSKLAAVVGFVMLILLFGIALLTGELRGPYDPTFWVPGLMPPVITVYLLLMQSRSRRLRNEAIKAIRPLVKLDGDHFQLAVSNASLFNRRREWMAFCMGVVAGWLLLVAWGFGTLWLSLYSFLFDGLMFGLLAWFIYSALSGTRLFNELNQHTHDLNIFNLEPLEPIARWSLSIALTLIGGITLSLLVSVPGISNNLFMNLQGFIIYGSLITATISVFFLNMYSTHRALVRAKTLELKRVRLNLAKISNILKEQSERSRPMALEELSSEITSWVTYEKRIKEVPEWPYTSQIGRNLLISVFLSIVAFILPWMLRGVLFQFLLELLPIG
jgi:hypothetical protein